MNERQIENSHKQLKFSNSMTARVSEWMFRKIIADNTTRHPKFPTLSSGSHPLFSPLSHACSTNTHTLKRAAPLSVVSWVLERIPKWWLPRRQTEQLVRSLLVISGIGRTFVSLRSSCANLYRVTDYGLTKEDISSLHNTFFQWVGRILFPPPTHCSAEAAEVVFFVCSRFVLCICWEYEVKLSRIQKRCSAWGRSNILSLKVNFRWFNERTKERQTVLCAVFFEQRKQQSEDFPLFQGYTRKRTELIQVFRRMRLSGWVTKLLKK